MGNIEAIVTINIAPIKTIIKRLGFREKLYYYKCKLLKLNYNFFNLSVKYYKDYLKKPSRLT